jgi:hypothetical protein
LDGVEHSWNRRTQWRSLKIEKSVLKSLDSFLSKLDRQ